MKIILSLLVGLCSWASLLAQSGLPFFSMDDSTAVFYFYKDDFELEKRADTLGHFQRYIPVLMGDVDHNYLGNFGSAHYPLLYQQRYREGFDLGFHNYDGYLITKEEVPFYNSRKPYSDASYNAASQEDAFIQAKFSQNFSRRANIFLSYKRANHKGSFTNQQVVNSNYTFSAWYRSPNDEYKAFVSYAGNTIKNRNNGGIENDTLLENQIYAGRRDLIPVRIENSQTEYTHNEFSVSQYWNPFSKVEKRVRFVVDTLPLLDSTVVETDSAFAARLVKRKIPPRAMSDTPKIPESSFLHHELTVKREKLKFFDTHPTDNADYYGIYYVNALGLRNLVRVNQIKNHFSARLFLGNKEGSSYFRIEPGLSYAFSWIYQEPAKTFYFNDLRLRAKMRTKIKEYVRFDAETHFALASGVGDYLVKADLNIDLKKFGKVVGGISQQQYSPALLQERLIVSGVHVWDLDWLKPLETQMYVRYRHEQLKGELEARFQNLNRWIYNDTLSLPAQAQSGISIGQFMASKEVEFGKFHWENKVALQLISSDLLALPKFWWRSSVFYENILFKDNLQLRTGLDIRYNTNFYGNAYIPVASQFYLQTSQKLTFYPIVDPFIAIKVKQFKAFLKVENISQIAFQKSYLAAPNYPGRDWLLKFSIAWSFMD